MSVDKVSRRQPNLKTPLYLATLLASSLLSVCVAIGSAGAQNSVVKPSSAPLVPEAQRGIDTLSDVENEVVILIKESVSAADVRRMASNADGQVGDEPGSEIRVVEFDEANGNKEFIASKVEELEQDPDVISAEPNAFVESHYRPNDTFINRPQGAVYQSNLNLVGMPVAWSKSKGNGAVVGISDTGIMQQYGELPPAKVLAQRDVLNGDAVAEDNHGHGTSVALLAAARTDNKFGMAGAGFNSKVAVCKHATLWSNGVVGGTIESLGKCLSWLQKRPEVDVINLSLGMPDGKTSELISRKIQEAQQVYGKVIVASAGNDGKYTKVHVPASLPGVIAVGSNDNRSSRSSFSNYGPYVDIMAPGNGVVTFVDHVEKPVFQRGTSYSAPQVAGCAALLSAKGYNAGQIRNRLLKSATDMGPVGRDDRTGYGLLNCGRAFSN